MTKQEKLDAINVSFERLAHANGGEEPATIKFCGTGTTVDGVHYNVETFFGAGHGLTPLPDGCYEVTKQTALDLVNAL